MINADNQFPCAVDLTYQQLRFLLAEGIIWTLALFVVWWWRAWWIRFWSLLFWWTKK